MDLNHAALVQLLSGMAQSALHKLVDYFSALTLDVRQSPPPQTVPHLLVHIVQLLFVGFKPVCSQADAPQRDCAGMPACRLKSGHAVV
ncbi:hypothetical protein, partial [Cohnella sp.]|uniref:hypothetical protein n=1 Tax=Cohnella sp. TaxID=1883426 RepID=UPI00257EE47B